MKHLSIVFLICGLLAFSIAFCPNQACAVVVGETDNFQDGSTENWRWGRDGFGGPENVDGGPTGAGDLYLQNESFGGGDAPGSRMAIINRDQWSGDFISSGITAIRLDAINLGPNFAFEDINVRLSFSSQDALIGSGRVSTIDSFLLERNSGWQSLLFKLDPTTDLTPLAGSNVMEVMSSVFEIRIISAEQPAFIGDQFTARLGVDNITALPEPSSLGMMILGISCGLIGKRNGWVGRANA